MKQITISSGKGGSGKTTLTTNLAAYLSQEGKKVLLIDMDVQANASFTYGVRGAAYNVLDIYKGYVTFERAVIHVAENLDLISCNKGFSKLMFEDTKTLLYFTKKLDYDYIIYDIPPSLENILYNVLKVIDEMVLLFAPEPYGVDGLLNLVDVIKEFNKVEKRNIKINGAIINMYDQRINLHKKMLGQIKEYSEVEGFKLYGRTIPRSVDFFKTLENGSPSLLEKDTLKTIILRELFEELVQS